MHHPHTSLGLLHSLVLLAMAIAILANADAATNITSPNCESQCGSLTVQYPFGIGPGANCSLNNEFDITCNRSFNRPKAFIGSTNIEVYNISDAHLYISNTIAWSCYDSLSGNLVSNSSAWTRLSSTSPYTFSELNKLTVIGCSDYGMVTGNDEVRTSITNCIAFCHEATDVVPGKCSSIGCCQVSIPKGLKYIETFSGSGSTNNTSKVRTFNPCSYVFLAEENKYTFRGLPDLGDMEFLRRIRANVPTLLDWAIGDLNCADAQKNNALVCQSNSTCIDSDTGSSGGYRCKCNNGYEGNPYLSQGCQDIDECDPSNTNQCEKHCFNTPGSYRCSCPQGYVGDGFKNGTRCVAKNSTSPILKYTLGSTLSFLVVLIGTTWLYLIIKRRNAAKRREKFFEQNGGVFLRQQIAGKGHGVDSVRVYTIKELEKATENYAESRIVGRGGYGIVYKGILPDKSEVAIKKSKLMDMSQKEQFINELIILAQINHRNVVKLMGCCLENEVPLLVYKFVSNDTLHHHIHSQPGGMAWLSWDNRLRIAAESADALAYLHSQASMPIIHRDVKSSNILLDDNYNTKISDFGASRLIPLDHSQVTTLVQGTLGYLDPEYFHTSQLTDKSDVYSFGVVLAELLTGQKPLGGNRIPEGKGLATYFVVSMKEKRLFQILEPRVMREGTLDQLQAVAEIVNRCLNLKGNDRPTMKEVAMELERLRRFTKHPWTDNEHGREDARRIMLESEGSDLYSAPSTPCRNTFGDGSSGSASIMLQENSSH